MEVSLPAAFDLESSLRRAVRTAKEVQKVGTDWEFAGHFEPDSLDHLGRLARENGTSGSLTCLYVVLSYVEGLVEAEGGQSWRKEGQNSGIL
jgi:hypothetical protein